MPALYHLDVDNRLPKGTRILAIGRRDWDQAKWLSEVREMIQDKIGIKFDEKVFKRFSDRLHYHRGDILSPQCYSELANTLNAEILPEKYGVLSLHQSVRIWGSHGFFKRARIV